MYLAKRHPEIVKKVVTLDNLRVPFATDGKFKILSFRSRDPVFKADPNVVPDDEICAKAGITVVRTEFHHNELSDRGPDHVKSTIQAKINQFLDDEEGADPQLAAVASVAAVAEPRRSMALSEGLRRPDAPNLAPDWTNCQQIAAKAGFKYASSIVMCVRGNMTYRIVAERGNETVRMDRASSLMAVAKARVWASEGWHVTIIVQDQDQLDYANTDRLALAS